MSDCRRFENHVHPLASGEIDGALALQLGMHAASCPTCDRVLRSARVLSQRLDRAAEVTVEPPANLVARIMGALPDDATPAARRWRFIGAGLAAALGVSVLLAVALLIASAAGLSLGPQMVELRSLMASVAGRLQQFAALLETLAGSLPRLPSPAAGGGGDPSTLLGLLLVMAGLFGTLATLTLSALRGVARGPARRA